MHINQCSNGQNFVWTVYIKLDLSTSAIEASLNAFDIFPSIFVALFLTTFDFQINKREKNRAVVDVIIKFRNKDHFGLMYSKLKE